MIFHKLRLINKNQSGVTFIELLIAITISGMITAGVTTAIFQVLIENARSNNHMTAVRQVQSAGYWVSHDAQMAIETTVDESSATGFPVTMYWSDFMGIDYVSSYNLTDMNGGLKELQRTYSVNQTVQESSVIARYINPTQTSCNLTDSMLLFEVTAIVGSGSRQGNETRIYEIIARPKL